MEFNERLTTTVFLNSFIQSIVNNIPKDLWVDSPFIIFFLLSFGALFGDMSASFFKRRSNLKRGDKSPLMDMFDFVGMALILTLIFGNGLIQSWLFDGVGPLFTLILLTPILHRGVNIIGFKIGVKNEPW